MSNPQTSSSQATDTPPRPADPTLRERPAKDPLRPFGAPKGVGAMLYAFFWVILLLPRMRRLWRGPHWNRVRLAAALAGSGLAVGGWFAPSLWLGVTGGILVLAALTVTRAQDPDRERKLQDRHGADYLLNGGVLVGGSLPGLPPGTRPGPRPLGPKQRLYFLIRGAELLVVPAEGPGDVVSTVDIGQVAEIFVAGEPYLPIYVSEAKDPPVRETSVMTGNKAELRLMLESGRSLCFGYQGAFAKHLAETAAHAIYSVRGMVREAESGESEALFEIVG